MKRGLCFLTFLCVISQLCWSQSGSQGTIIGTVSDPTGAVVPDAQVTVVNESTGLTRTATSNDRGDYRIDFLPPGVYRVGVKKEGFKTAIQVSMTLLVGQVLRVDISLSLGQTTELVTITATSTKLNTTSASQGAVIENNEIQELPLNGREFLSLAGLVPGAFTGTRPYDNPVPAKANIVVGFSGARGSDNSYYLDGGQNTAPNSNNMISSPPIDAVQEFRVETDQYTAKYGQAGGAVINVVTKSGTNEFRGSLYEYHRNKAVDAMPYFYQGTREAFPNSLWNQFGGAIGGPIAKDKLFFFFNAEYFRQRTAQQKISFAPTAAERAGDVSNSINPWSGQPVELTHPFTGEVIPSGILPEELKHPVGQALMDLWPEPNFNDPVFNFRPFRPVANDVNKYFGRIDANLSSQSSLSGSFNYGQYDNGVPGDIDLGDKVLAQHDRTGTVRFTHSFTPNFVSVTGGTYSQYLFGDQFRLNEVNNGVALGFDPSVNQNVGTPFIMLFTEGSQFFTFGANGDNKNQTKQGFVSEDLSWVRGRHTLHMGGVAWRQKYNWQFFSGHAQYMVNLIDGVAGAALWNLFGVTGSSYTNLLAGLYNLGVFGAGGGSYTRFHRDTFALYVQDTWKISPRFTLNLGVRWDYERPYRSLDGKYMNLDQATGLIRYAEGAPGIDGMQVPFLTDGPDLTYQSHPRTFVPRFGFAWQPFENGRTVVRGGYGIYAQSEQATVMQAASFMNPFAGPTVVWQKQALGGWPSDPDNQLRPFSEPPHGLDWARTHTIGCCMVFTEPEFPRSYLQRWNLTVGHDFAGNILGEVAYVGARGVNLSGYRPLESYSPTVRNMFLANYGGAVNPPFYIKGYNSNYNALQVSARRNVGQALSFLAAYTWSHSLAESSNTAVTENLTLNTVEGVPVYDRFQANAGFDVRHRLSVASVYELPFGRKRKWGAQWNKAADAVLGGWTVNLIYVAQSGFPWNVWTTGNLLPDRVCNGNLPESERTVQRWFDHTCFPTVIDPNTSQPVPGNSGANVIYGPGTNNWDIGIHKLIYFGEKTNLQIRMETFNTWNHPQLRGPAGVNWFNNTPAGEQIANAADQRQIQLALRFNF